MRILIAEDDAVLAEALRFSLSGAGYAVDHASDGARADEALRQDVFSLLILDITLPHVDGFEVLRRLRRRNATLPVLILSGREAPEEKVQGLDLGADDYLVKPFSLNELQARVRALMRRGQGSGVPALEYAGLIFDRIARTAKINGQPVALSPQETALLQVLLERFGRIVGKQQLVEQLYSFDREVTPNAIEVYVHRLRKKLQQSGVAVRTAYGRGYVIDYING